MSLEAALDLHRRGLSVFPVPRPRGGVELGKPGDGKVPAIPWAEFQERRPSKAEVEAMFKQPANIAIVTGKVSGVVVVDCDSAEAVKRWTAKFPYTPWQVSTARGFHLYYGHSGVKIGNKAKVRDLEVDVRGDGGYVIGPGSVHASGALYEFAGDWTKSREDLPRFWPGWIERPRPKHRQRNHNIPRPTGTLTERARKYLAAIPVPEIGQGSDNAVLTAACRLVRGFDLSDSDAVALLWEWCGGRPGWTRGWIENKVRNARRYGSEPVGAMK